MIKNIKNLGFQTKSLLRKVNPRSLITYTGIFAVSSAVNWQAAKVVAPNVMADIARAQRSTKEIVVKPIKKTLADSCINNKIYPINWENYIKNHSFKLQPFFKNEDNFQSKQVKLLVRIMDDDKACKVNNKEELASHILQVANEYKVDPVVLACIAKKESHFEQNVSNKTLKGIMQIGKISVDDMYQKHREYLYMPYIKDIKEKYKSSQELFKAIGEDSLLNIKVGALVYKSKLQKAQGNVFDSIKFYNNSSLKERYANSVYSDVNHYTNNSVLIY